MMERMIYSANIDDIQYESIFYCWSNCLLAP